VTVAGQTATTITVSVSPTPVVQGQPVTITATVGGNVTAGTNVDFFDGPTELGTAPVDASGVAQLTNQVLGPGEHNIIGLYMGDGTFGGSVSPTVSATVTVPNPGATTTTLAPAMEAVGVGDPVTLTATVTPTPDGGTVDFQDGATDLGTVPVDSNGVAVLDLVLPLGDHNIIAVYSGDADFDTSTST